MSFKLDGTKFRAFTDAGLPLAGGTLNTYASGTTNNKATYTDATLGSANTNPIVLDARGEADVWLGSGAYTFLLKTSAGVTVDTVDWVVDPQDAAESAIRADLASPAAGKGASGIGVHDASAIAQVSTPNNVESYLTEIANQYAIPVRRYLPDGYVPGRTSCSSAVQAAVNAAISSGNGCVSFEGIDYYFGTEVTLGAAGIEGGVALLGPAANSMGRRANLIQANIATSCFRVKTLNCRASHFSATVFSGAILDDTGAQITVTAVTVNTITLSKDPWPGQSPVVWSTFVNTPSSTDGTAFPSLIQFNLLNGAGNSGGVFYASGATKNGDGTVTLTGVKGALGTANAFIAGTVGFHVTQFVSQAHNLTDAQFAAPTPATFFLDVAENQWFDHLWFNQVGACFGRDTLGSGAGLGAGVGNFGSFSDMVVDQAGWWITSVGDVNNLQANGIQLFGVRHGIKTQGNFTDSILLNVKTQACTKMLEVVGDMRGVTCGVSNFEAVSGPNYTYINGFFSVGGQILDCSWGAGVIYGRSANGVAPWTIGTADGFSLAGANIRSWNEGGTGGFLAITGASFRRSTVTANWSDATGTSTGNKVVFTNTAADITGSVFGDDCADKTNHTQLGWQVPTYTNSWIQAVGAVTTAYRKDSASKLVSLKGQISGGATGTSAFTLPTWARPVQDFERFIVPISGNNTCLVEVRSSGLVNLTFAAPNSWVSLSGVQFLGT